MSTDFPAGRMLDVEIAQRVMGWTLIDCMLWRDQAGACWFTGVDQQRPKAGARTFRTFHPSEDIKAAMLVVERVHDLLAREEIYGNYLTLGALGKGSGYVASFGCLVASESGLALPEQWLEHPEHWPSTAWGVSAAHAICQAALLAVKQTNVYYSSATSVERV